MCIVMYCLIMGELAIYQRFWSLLGSNELSALEDAHPQPPTVERAGLNPSFHLRYERGLDGSRSYQSG